MMRPFSQIDVFGDSDGDGNPLAVVHEADGLSQSDMQRLANWTNLSETTFLLASTVPDADYRVRIFTPAHELAFAGHPTLGSAHAWLEHGGEPAGAERIVQECGAGLVTLRRAGGRLGFAAPPLVRSGALDPPTLAEVTATLGVAPEHVVDHAWTDNGPGWATVLLDCAERVLALSPRLDRDLKLGVVGLHPDGTPELRAFFVTDGITREDPVTGSLNAGVAQWLLESGRLSAPYVARQGTALGRRGRVHVDRDAAGAVWVGGRTETRISGSVAL